MKQSPSLSILDNFYYKKSFYCKKKVTKILRIILLLFGAAVLTSGCDRPACSNTNPVFEKYGLDTKEYNDEMVRQLAKTDKSTLTYWVAGYSENGNSRYITVQVQGDGLCALMNIEVRDSEKGIEILLEKKGMGYKGAELLSLKFDICQDEQKTEFVFRETRKILD